MTVLDLLRPMHNKQADVRMTPAMALREHSKGPKKPTMAQAAQRAGQAATGILTAAAPVQPMKAAQFGAAVATELLAKTAKSTSKAQQRLFGMVHAVQKGEMTAPSKKVQEIAGDISPSSAEDFAETKRTGLPEHAKSALAVEDDTPDIDRQAKITLAIRHNAQRRKAKPQEKQLPTMPKAADFGAGLCR
jgi:hypothetical protein